MTDDAIKAASPALTDVLGPVPKAGYTLVSGGSITWTPGYSAQDMTDYAIGEVARAVAAERERMRTANAEGLARAVAMLQRLEFSVDTHSQTGKDTMGCPCCEGGCIVGLTGAHREGCELDALLRELAP